MGAGTEIVGEEGTSIPAKALDSREDRNEDEPGVAISGAEIMTIGKYQKPGWFARTPRSTRTTGRTYNGSGSL